MRENSVEQFYYTSHLSIRDYLMIAIVFRSFQPEDSLKPLLPFANNSYSSLISVDLAKKILCTFLARDNADEDEISQVEQEFANLLKGDLYDRLYNKGNNMQARNFKIEQNFITYDVLAGFIIDRNVKKLVVVLQKFLSALTTNSAARGEKNISFDDMQYSCRDVFPHADIVWVHKIYRKLVDTPFIKGTSLENSIDNTLECIINTDSVMDTFKGVCLSSEQKRMRNLYLDEVERKFEAQKKGKRQQTTAMLNLEAVTNSLKSWQKSFTNKKKISKTEKVTLKLDLENEERKLLIDNISSLAALEESYEILKSSIVSKERNDDTVQLLHQDIKEFLSKMPSEIINCNSFEGLDEFDQTKLKDELDLIWKKFRKTVTKTFYKME